MAPNLPEDHALPGSASHDLRPAYITGSPFDSRLNFLYKVVEDTQNTIRFLDTKAAFCVTLLSGMVAAELQRPAPIAGLRRHLFVAFFAGTILSLLICLRVIFPTIKPSSSIFGSRGPKFFIGHNKAHQWILHTLKDRVGEVLSETHNSYLGNLTQATDEDLLSSMCDEVLMVALIRQVKSDRLHAAMFSIAATVLLFAVLMTL